MEESEIQVGAYFTSAGNTWRIEEIKGDMVKVRRSWPHIDDGPYYFYVGSFLLPACVLETRTKQIDFSYPTSDNATKFKFLAGCWTVSIAEGNNVAKAVAGFSTEAEAIAYAKTLHMPFGRLWSKYDAA